MIENILVFLIVSILVFSSKEKRAVGWLVFCYYSAYIILELDYFGFTIGNVFTTYPHFVKWYLIYTAVSFLFFIASLIIFLTKESKTALFYACWILLNMFISGLSAIFQSLETNSMLIVYNVLQNLNLLVDVMVVILGTDANVKGLNHVRTAADRVYRFTISYISSTTKAISGYK